MWRFIDLDLVDGYFSAAFFEAVGRHVGSRIVPETILFWRVASPVVYLGYHQYVEEEVREDYCTLNNIGLVRRILGGGCGFCDENQVLYSIIGREDGVIPYDVRDAYAFVLRGVLLALDRIGLRGEIEGKRNAVYVGGRKISGNAQGRFGGAVLVNGSLLLDFDFDSMDMALKNPTKNLNGVKRARDGMTTLAELLETPWDLGNVKRLLRKSFEDALGSESKEDQPSQGELELAWDLVSKYRSSKWKYRMDLKRKARKSGIQKNSSGNAAVSERVVRGA